MKIAARLGVAALALILAWLLLGAALRRPYAAFAGETFVEFPRGTSTRRMAEMLASAGVVPSAWQFLVARVLNPHRRLKAGEYRFDKPATVLEVFDRIARGDVFYYQLSVPEGQNMFDIAASLERLGVMSPDEFLRAARDPALISDLDPRARGLEGYLFPETYRITRHQTGPQICRMMTDRFRKTWQDLGAGANAHDVVTLASLVEKEAAVPEDRPLIASVFRNRLKIGMKLDCDPSTVYAAMLEGSYRGSIYRKDLESRNPYNTYQNPGLPPGPIANPGDASLRAALHPAETNYLYFVLKTDGSGRHQFSATMAQHQKAAARYRRANHLGSVESDPAKHQKGTASRVSHGKSARAHR